MGGKGGRDRGRPLGFPTNGGRAMGVESYPQEGACHGATEVHAGVQDLGGSTGQRAGLQSLPGGQETEFDANGETDANGNPFAEDSRHRWRTEDPAP
jgi:hypothetical protein